MKPKPKPKPKTKPRKGYTDYTEYIQSTRWKKKHSAWLKLSHNRCCALPWMRCGRLSTREYFPYRINHMHYHTLGKENYWWDVIVLSEFADQKIYHGLLRGGMRPSQQNELARQYPGWVWAIEYPNLLQRLFNFWCRFVALWIMLS